MENIGYLYCLSNSSYENNTYKIGYTKNDPKIRISQLNTTGLIQPFTLEFAKKVCNIQEKEKIIHKILDKHRINKNREFFKINIDEIKDLFNLLDGEWYNNISDNINEKISDNICVKINKKINNKIENKINKCNICDNIIKEINYFNIKCSHKNFCYKCIVKIKECNICNTLFNL